MKSPPRDILEPATVAFTADGVNWDEVMDYVRNHVEDFLFGQIGYENTDYMTLDKIREAVRNCKDVVEMGEVMGFLSPSRRSAWKTTSGTTSPASASSSCRRATRYWRTSSTLSGR